jgi:hypothetical protein
VPGVHKTSLALIAVLAAALMISAVAFAASPQVPAKFLGGGGGAPVNFSLDKHGKATAGFFAFTCSNANGIATARTDSKHKPSGKVSHGKITITYSAKIGGTIGTVKAKIKATFTSTTHAKGTTSVSGWNCKHPTSGKFTADSAKVA